LKYQRIGIQKVRIKKIFVFSLLFLLVDFCSPTVQKSIIKSTGSKYFKNYTPKDYDHHPQNWAVGQGKRGIIYVGNQAGLLEFDGVSWRIIGIPNWTVRSLDIDETGTIYIGGKDEIGFLSPSTNGTLEYVSLLNKLEDSEKNFSEIKGTHAARDGIYFRASHFVFLWNPGLKKMKVWEADHPFKASFYCREKFFLQQENVGLLQMENGSLFLVPGGETFANDEIFALCSYHDQDLLICTRTKGLYIYNGNDLRPFPTEIDGYIKEKYLSYGIRLSNGDFALSTLRGGIAVIDSQGKLKYLFDKTSGLLDNDVKFVFEDSDQNLWLALNNGVSKVEYASPFYIYNERNNLTGLILSVVRSHNKLYVGTTNGLFYCLISDQGRFYPIPGINRMCWSLALIGDSILAAADKGVFQIKKDKLHKIFPEPTYVILHSSVNPNRLWLGTKSGFASMFMNPQKKNWTIECECKKILHPIRSLVEDEEGNLWLGTLTRGVIRVDFPGNVHYPVINRFDTSHGLPPTEVYVFLMGGHVMFATEKGLFRFDKATKMFIPDKSLGSEFADGSRNVFRAVQDKNRTIWFHSAGRNFQAVPGKDKNHVTYSTPFLRIPIGQVNAIYPDPVGKNIWFAANDGLIRFDKTVKKDYTLDFSTFIRRVQLINEKSLIFNGRQLKDMVNYRFDYKNRNLRFQFAAPFFEDEPATTYQVFLEGYDSRWSSWTGETQKDYTNLHPGAYIFRVRAKNIYNHLSREALFKFKIKPPWYLTWWSFLIYGCCFFLMIYMLVKWRSFSLEQEKLRLERIVTERTSEIENKNRQLEEQSGKLKEMDRIKSRFFANISHEFRTPLTLIMGPLEQIIGGKHNKELKKKVNLALRNSQRLLALINQLLDLSKLESGKVKLNASKQDIIPFLKGIVSSFDSLAVEKNLNLTFHSDEENIVLYYDQEKLEKVINNLISNAFKFTPDGGEIALSVVKSYSQGEKVLPPFLEISVSDTGIGIPENQLPFIFDRFYQVEKFDSLEHKQEGTGIGLALVKELITLHHGHVEVKNKEGYNSGTEFIICLPFGNVHLESGEVSPKKEIECEPIYIHRESDKISTDSIIAAEAEEVDHSTTNDALVEVDELETEKEDQGKKEKNVVLVVEDNAEVREYIRESLEIHYKVEEAVNGREGIAKAQKIIPDLIISDVMMPEADGYQLCGVLKKDIKTSHIPVILLTAKASEESMAQGLETGADDYVTKPFNTKILLIRVKNLIYLRRMLQQKIQNQMLMQPDEISVSSMDQIFFKELQELIEKNLSDPNFNVEQLSKKLYLSQSTLLRKILALTGESPSRFIRSYRLKRALQLMKANFGNITEVAFEVGFSNTAYFSKCFKDKFHQTPSSFMELNQ